MGTAHTEKIEHAECMAAPMHMPIRCSPKAAHAGSVLLRRILLLQPATSRLDRATLAATAVTFLILTCLHSICTDLLAPLMHYACIHCHCPSSSVIRRHVKINCAMSTSSNHRRWPRLRRHSPVVHTTSEHQWMKMNRAHRSYACTHRMTMV